MVKHLPEIWRALFLALLLAVLAYAPAEGQTRSWVSVTGKSVDCGTDYVTLDYGDGLVKVDLKDLAWCINASLMKEGTTVTVYGFIDETREGEPASRLTPVAVYEHEQNTIYYRDQIDRKSGTTIYAERIPVRAGDPVNAIGMVIKVSGREFRLDTGHALVYIDTGKMTYNPLDAEGGLRIKDGDVISVEGYMDRGPLNRYEIQARRIVKLSR